MGAYIVKSHRPYTLVSWEQAGGGSKTLQNQKWRTTSWQIEDPTKDE